MEPISSSQNPLLKRARAVAAGREPGAVLLEGDRLVEEACRQDLRLELVLVGADRSERARELLDRGHPVRTVVPELLAAVSRLKSSPGVLAVAAEPSLHALDELPRAGAPLVVVVAGIQDPGNLGALARTAEAAGAVALILAGEGCSPWNGKALRGSMGSLLRLPLLRADSPVAVQRALADGGYRQACARTRGGRSPRDFDWSGALALWLTGETGRAPDELDLEGPAFEGLTLPLAGGVESLNVTAAAAVLLFAAGRNG